MTPHTIQTTFGELTLPKKYLSYSAMDLFHRDRENFRNIYYFDAPRKSSIYTDFGSEVHKRIETEVEFEHLRLGEQEKKIFTEYEGIPLLGYVDTVAPEGSDIDFADYKTGMHPWTQERADAHQQLVMYSLLFELAEKRIATKSAIIWLETKKEEATQNIGGVVITYGETLALTGRVETFPVTITEEAKQEMRDFIVNTAKAISDDMREVLAE